MQKCYLPIELSLTGLPCSVPSPLVNLEGKEGGRKGRGQAKVSLSSGLLVPLSTLHPILLTKFDKGLYLLMISST
jgi:hypothetical protein